jgi:methionyl-tRNA synthetase
MEISSAGNALLQFNEPWKTVKENPETVRVVMNLSLQIVAALSVAARPFIPFAADRLRNMLNLPPLQDRREWLDMLNELAEGNPLLRPNHALGQAEHLFSRIPDEVIAAQIAKLDAAGSTGAPPQTDQAPAEKPAYAPLRDPIQYDDFAKMDIRTGTILHAEKMEKSKKLLLLQVDLGFEQRTILSGIAEHFSPEAVIGRQVLVLANLAPRKMMGVDSQGMILMAEDATGKLGFVSPETGWPNGNRVA